MKLLLILTLSLGHQSPADCWVFKVPKRKGGEDACPDWGPAVCFGRGSGDQAESPRRERAEISALIRRPAPRGSRQVLATSRAEEIWVNSGNPGHSPRLGPAGLGIRQGWGRGLVQIQI